MNLSDAQLAVETETVSKPTYRGVIKPCKKRVRIVFAGETIADSITAVVLHETRLAPVYYFPRKDVHMEFLQRTKHHTHCPFKGNASYWNIKTGNQVADNVAWSYEDPIEDAQEIKGYLAFSWNAMEAWYEDERQIQEQTRDLIPSGLNIFSGWLLHNAWDTTSVRDLVLQMAHCMWSSGLPILRLQLVIRTLHPQLFATSYTWWRDTEKIEISKDVTRRAGDAGAQGKPLCTYPGRCGWCATYYGQTRFSV